MDDTLSPETGTTDDGLPVQIATLEIDGVRPAAGDVVTMTVKGSITKIVDSTAWVKPDTVNGAPMPEETPNASDDEMMKSAMAHDAAVGAPY